MNGLDRFVVSILGLGSSLQARRTETMVDGLPCAASFENRKFHEKVTLVKCEGVIFNEFSSLTRISLPCGAYVYCYYMICR